MDEEPLPPDPSDPPAPEPTLSLVNLGVGILVAGVLAAASLSQFLGPPVLEAQEGRPLVAGECVAGQTPIVGSEGNVTCERVPARIALCHADGPPPLRYTFLEFAPGDANASAHAGHADDLFNVTGPADCPAALKTLQTTVPSPPPTTATSVSTTPTPPATSGTNSTTTSTSTATTNATSSSPTTSSGNQTTSSSNETSSASNETTPASNATTNATTNATANGSAAFRPPVGGLPPPRVTYPDLPIDVPPVVIVPPVLPKGVDRCLARLRAATVAVRRQLLLPSRTPFTARAASPRT